MRNRVEYLRTRLDSFFANTSPATGASSHSQYVQEDNRCLSQISLNDSHFNSIAESTAPPRSCSHIQRQRQAAQRLQDGLRPKPPTKKPASSSDAIDPSDDNPAAVQRFDYQGTARCSLACIVVKSCGVGRAPGRADLPDYISSAALKPSPRTCRLPEQREGSRQKSRKAPAYWTSRWM